MRTSNITMVYWIVGSSNAVPDSWPRELSTDINYEYPANVTMNNETYNAFITSSPPRFNPSGRTNDADAIVEIIRSAEDFIYVAVMEYSPVIAYEHKVQFWPVIDDAIRQSALENNVKVKMLISYWNHSNPAEDHFLHSLSSLTKAYKGVSVEIKRFIVPATPAQAKIPYARVNHNKYMVTDKVAYIGTSNWYGDYFTTTAGVAVVISDKNPNDLYRNHTDDDLRIQLKDTFERDWYSPYAVPLRPL